MKTQCSRLGFANWVGKNTNENVYTLLNILYILAEHPSRLGSQP